jgi:hypothetical protein
VPLPFWEWASALEAPSRRSQLRYGVDVGAWVVGSSPMDRLRNLAMPVERQYKPVPSPPPGIDVLVELCCRLPHLPAVRALAIAGAVFQNRLDVAMWLERDVTLDDELRLSCIRDFLSHGSTLRWMKWKAMLGGWVEDKAAKLLLLADAAELGSAASRQDLLRIAVVQLAELAPCVNARTQQGPQSLDRLVEAEQVFATVFGMCWSAESIDHTHLGSSIAALRNPTAVDRCFDEVRRLALNPERHSWRNALASMLLHDDPKVRHFAGRVMTASAATHRDSRLARGG